MTPVPRAAARSDAGNLEGEPHARADRVGVFGFMFHTASIGGVERVTRREPSSNEVERHVRGKLPPESDIRLGADVAGVTLLEAVGVHDGTSTAGAAGVSVNFLRRPRRVDGPEDAERRRDTVCRPGAEVAESVPVITHAAARVGPSVTAGTEVGVTQGDDRAPAAPVARVSVERLEVQDSLREVVPGLVPRAVRPTNLEEQRAELVAADGVEEEGAHLRLDLAAECVHDIAGSPLVVERGVEAPGTQAPAGVEAYRVAVFAERRTAVRAGTGSECRCRVRCSPREMRVGRVTPGVAVRHAFGIEERVERLDVEPLVDRVVRAEDERGVLAPARTRGGRQPILDHDIGDVRLQVRRKRRDRREAGKITGRVGDLGGGGEVSEGLEARPRDARHRDERQYAIPAGEIELRVEPLDLDDAGDVRVETGARGHPRDLSGGVGSGTLTCTVSFSTSLTPAQVQLESHHGLGPSYLERKVRTEPGPGVPIIVPGTREVSVLVVPAERRDLVEEPGD